MEATTADTSQSVVVSVLHPAILALMIAIIVWTAIAVMTILRSNAMGRADKAAWIGLLVVLPGVGLLAWWLARGQVLTRSPDAPPLVRPGDSAPTPRH